MSLLITETERLAIRKVELSDAPFFYRLLNSPTWLQFIGDRGVHSLELAKNYIEKSILNSYLSNGYGLYLVAIKAEEIPIGTCGFLKRNYLDHPDLGFAIMPEYAGKGYITEASHALLHYAHYYLKFTQLYAITTSENYKSQRLLYKIGFRHQRNIRPEPNEPEFLLYSHEISNSYTHY